MAERSRKLWGITAGMLAGLGGGLFVLALVSLMAPTPDAPTTTSGSAARDEMARAVVAPDGGSGAEEVPSPPEEQAAPRLPHLPELPAAPRSPDPTLAAPAAARPSADAQGEGESSPEAATSTPGADGAAPSVTPRIGGGVDLPAGAGFDRAPEDRSPAAPRFERSSAPTTATQVPEAAEPADPPEIETSPAARPDAATEIAGIAQAPGTPSEVGAADPSGRADRSEAPPPTPGPAATPAPDAAPTSPPGLLEANAVQFEAPDGTPFLAVVLLHDPALADAASIALADLAVTVAIDPAAPGAGEAARAFRRAGLEVALRTDEMAQGRPAGADEIIRAALDVVPEPVALVGPTSPDAADLAFLEDASPVADRLGLGVLALGVDHGPATSTVMLAGEPPARLRSEIGGVLAASKREEASILIAPADLRVVEALAASAEDDGVVLGPLSAALRRTAPAAEAEGP
jgi:hypothetical protein